MTFCPTTHRIIFPVTGGVAVSVVSPDCELPIEDIIAQTVPENTPYRIISTAELPANQHFRNAWTFVDDEDEAPITVDMVKARDIHREKIRAARAPRLTALDTQFMQALETSIATTAIVAAKQALRDAPAAAAIDAATHVNDLIAQWNTEMLGPSPYLS